MPIKSDTSHRLNHFNDRPPGTIIDTIVIHSMFAPNEPDPYSPQSCISLLDAYTVSAHYLITQEGYLWNLVNENMRAWHAGESKMCFPDVSRENVNNFSIGIELIGRPDLPFNNKQYEALARAVNDIFTRHPITTIVGHSDITPGRKTDPGVGFDWKKLRELLAGINLRFAN